MESPHPVRPRRDAAGKRSQPVLAVPIGQFVHVEQEGMVGRDVSGIDVSVQVLVPARNTFGMGFDAESVQLALAHGGEGGRALSGGAELGFIRQQIIAKVVARSEELLDVAAQCSHGACGFRAPAALLFPLLPVSVGRFFLCVFQPFGKGYQLSRFLQEPVLLQSHQFFLHKYFLLK